MQSECQLMPENTCSRRSLKRTSGDKNLHSGEKKMSEMGTYVKIKDIVKSFKYRAKIKQFWEHYDMSIII